MAFRYTHVYDLAHRVLRMVGALMVTLSALEIVEPISQPIHRYLSDRGQQAEWGLLATCFVVGAYAGGVFLLNRTLLQPWLSTNLYVHTILLTRVTREEALRLSFLFDGSLRGSLYGAWYPLSYLRHLDNECRRDALFHFANRVAARFHYSRPFPEAEPREEARTRSGADDSGWNERRDSRRAESLQQHEQAIMQSLRLLGLSALPKDFVEIKQAYRRKISQFHPDKFAGAAADVVHYRQEMAKKINFAYAYLEKAYGNASA